MELPTKSLVLEFNIPVSKTTQEKIRQQAEKIASGDYVDALNQPVPNGFRTCDDCKLSFNPLMHHECPVCNGILPPWTCFYCGHNYKEDGASGTMGGHPACCACIEKGEDGINNTNNRRLLKKAILELPTNRYDYAISVLEEKYEELTKVRG